MPVSRSGIQVEIGYFTITKVDFGGNAFNGEAYGRASMCGVPRAAAVTPRLRHANR